MNTTELRDRMMAAYRRGDDDTVRDLGLRHADDIVGDLWSWLRPPRSPTFDRRAVGRWIRDSVAVANRLAEHGEVRPLDMLVDWRGSLIPPFHRWFHMYGLARTLARFGDQEKVAGLLRNLLSEVRGESTPVVDDLRIEAMNLLGPISVRLGHFDEAAHCAREILRRGDDSGADVDITAVEEILAMATAAEEMAGSGPQAIALRSLRERICTAQSLSDVGRYSASNSILTEVLAGDPDDRYLAKIHGLIGSNAHHLHDSARARRHTERALARCRRTGDITGETIYAANLRAIDEG